MIEHVEQETTRDAMPEVEVVATVSKIGNSRFALRRNGTVLAIAPINDKYKTEAEAIARGEEIISAIRAPAYRRGYLSGFNAGKAEGVEAETIQLRDAHADHVADIRKGHKYELTRVEARGHHRGVTVGALWGFVIGCGIAGGAVIWAYQLGWLAGWLG